MEKQSKPDWMDGGREGSGGRVVCVESRGEEECTGAGWTCVVVGGGAGGCRVVIEWRDVFRSLPAPTPLFPELAYTS